MQIKGYKQFGGIHGESAAIRHLMAHHGIDNPVTKSSFSEAMCFGLAGGIGAGYSFCPSMIRHGVGSGTAVIGRHKAYVTDAAWYQGAFDRLGVKSHITETAAKGKAYKNLVSGLEAGFPVVVWCSKSRLPVMGELAPSCDYWMHSLVVYSIDEEKSQAMVADCPKKGFAISLEQLADARDGICSHKNRTLTIEPTMVSTKTLTAALTDAIGATAQGMLQGKIKTFSLPGWENWAKMITNTSNKAGWLKAYPGGAVYGALRDVYASIETQGTGGGLLRGLYADFLEEAGVALKNDAVSQMADTYRGLQQQWTELAESALPKKVKPFATTKKLLHQRWKLFVDKGDKGEPKIQETVEKLQALDREMVADFPLDEGETEKLLAGLKEQILDLHSAESDAIVRLSEAIGSRRRASA